MKEKNIILLLVLSFLTFGIYAIFWIVSMANEIAEICPEEYNVGGWKMILFSILTCGIYTIFWFYKAGKMLAKVNATKADNSVIYLLLHCIGLGIVSMALIQDELNKINAQKSCCA